MDHDLNSLARDIQKKKKAERDKAKMFRDLMDTMMGREEVPQFTKDHWELAKTMEDISNLMHDEFEPIPGEDEHWEDKADIIRESLEYMKLVKIGMEQFLAQRKAK